MDYEELALKSMDPALGPKLSRPDVGLKKEGKKNAQVCLLLLFNTS